MYIYDIGANTGEFTKAALNAYPQAHIVMVEANDALVSNLVAKFQNQSVTTINKAIAKVSDVDIDFYISNVDVLSTSSIDFITNSRFAGKYSWSRVVKKTITIDKLLETYPSPEIIKIDVEGYEFEAIQGLTKKQNKICFEWTEEQEDNIQKTLNYLESLGYAQFGFIYQDSHLVEPDIWTTKQDCLKSMDMIPSRQEKWGMIWVR